MLQRELAKARRRGRRPASASTSPSRARSCSTSCGSTGIRIFAELLAAPRQGPRLRDLQAGGGVDPGVAAASGYVLDGEQAALQDTNDHFLANLQKDGTYSVVPRMPGGEITPDKLIAIGEVARDFGLYTKITGGQRIDLFGARVEQLPPIWQRLVDAGLRVGPRLRQGAAHREVVRRHAPGAATACRTRSALAIELELRYRGLRAPHKLKSAVSGCTRECAEAQSKDFGVIATEKGWNLYVCGNGGMRPQHAVLLRRGPRQRDACIRYIDRFLMFYIRTADRLERTATWLNKLDGGIDHLRRSRRRRRARHRAPSSRPTWQRTSPPTSASGRRRSRIPSGSPGSCIRQRPEPDPNVVFVEERGQIRPARPTRTAPA